MSNNSDNTNTSQINKVNMASALTALTTFSGKDDEVVKVWLKQAVVIGRVSYLSEQDIIRLIILRTKDIAQAWAASLITDNPIITLEVLIQRMKTRFITTSSNHELLEKFLNLKAPKSKEEYIQLLKKAFFYTIKVVLT